MTVTRGTVAVNAMSDVAWKLLRLPPRLDQLANTARFAWCFARGRFPARLPYRPVSVGVHVTRRCNLRCPFCYNQAVNRDGAAAGDITVPQFVRLLEHPNLRPAIRVTFFGGEPLLHRDLFRLAALTRQARKLSYMTTNGLLLESRLEEMRAAPLDTVQLSLYDGQLDRQIEGARLLRRTVPRVTLILSRIVTSHPDTWASMRQVMAVAGDLRVRRVLFAGYSPMTEQDRALCYDEDNIAMREFLREFAAEFGHRFDLELPLPLHRDTRRRFCIAHYLAPYVAPDGSMAPCCEITPPSADIGNVFDPDFWNNEYFLHFRGQFRDGFPVHPRCRDCPTSCMGRSKRFFA